MVERPILFSGPMVRAILDGRKTQTRRLVKRQPHDGVGRIFVDRYCPAIVDRAGELQPGPEVFGAYDEDGEWGCPCQYGEPGDTLWVRETWHSSPHFDCLYRADYADEQLPNLRKVIAHGGWRPSIFMPRGLSRLSLLVKSVRVERLQEITEDDAHAEGVSDGPGSEWDGRFRSAFMGLWDVINGKRAAWVSNPWVWVVGFEVKR